MARYTWPCAAALAHGCVDVLSWDRHEDSAMFVGKSAHGARRRTIANGRQGSTVHHNRCCNLTRVSVALFGVPNVTGGMQECTCVRYLYIQVSNVTALT